MAKSITQFGSTQSTKPIGREWHQLKIIKAKKELNKSCQIIKIIRQISHKHFIKQYLAGFEYKVHGFFFSKKNKRFNSTCLKLIGANQSAIQSTIQGQSDIPRCGWLGTSWKKPVMALFEANLEAYLTHIYLPVSKLLQDLLNCCPVFTDYL
jgi:hypothetical protein